MPHAARGMTRTRWRAGAACLAALLALSAPLADRRAHGSEPAQIVLDEEQIVRFVASLPAMAAARARMAGPPVLVEPGADDPLVAFAALAGADGERTAALRPVLAAHSFPDLDGWLAVGQAVMTAYWSVSGDGRLAALAEQMAPVALAVRGVEEPTADDLAAVAGAMHVEMRIRRRAGIPQRNLVLAEKFEADIARQIAAVRKNGNGAPPAPIRP